MTNEENPYYTLSVMNGNIHHIRDEQNRKYHISNAKNSGIASVAILHEKIETNHDQILAEVNALMDSGYTGYPMAYMDKTQNVFTQGKTLWSPIWVKFIDTWAGTAASLPTLKQIVSEVDDVLLLHVSVFKPGTELPMHSGISMGVWRYHYGLTIPEGNLGINIGGQTMKWYERKGFIWDDTISHKAWNLTNETRLIIFADVYREGIDKDMLVKTHRDIQKMETVKSVGERLEKECVKKGSSPEKSPPTTESIL